MARCTCPTHCKGGREVSERTLSRHRKKLRDQEHRQLIQQWFPERLTPLSDTPRRRRCTDDDETQGARRKKARRSDGQGDNGDTQSVSVSASLSRLKLMPRCTGDSRRQTHRKRTGQYWRRTRLGPCICTSTLIADMSKQAGQVPHIVASIPPVVLLVLFKTTLLLLVLPPTILSLAVHLRERNRQITSPLLILTWTLTMRVRSPTPLATLSMVSGQETQTYLILRRSRYTSMTSRTRLRRSGRSGTPHLTLSLRRRILTVSDTQLRRSSTSTIDTSAFHWTCTSSSTTLHKKRTPNLSQPFSSATRRRKGGCFPTIRSNVVSRTSPGSSQFMTTCVSTRAWHSLVHTKILTPASSARSLATILSSSAPAMGQPRNPENL